MPSAVLIINLGAPFRIRAGTDIEAATGAVAIGDVSVAAGVSSTHLAQRFKEVIGLTPKRLARTYRFAATVLAIDPAGPVDWVELAVRAPETPLWALPEQRRTPMGKVVLYSTVSVDGFIADENDQPGPLFDWLSSGDVPLDEAGQLKVSQASYEHTRAYWDQIGVTVVGRHVFDLTDGWGGTPPSGIDHVVVVSHRPAPEDWDPEAPFHFVDGVEAAMAKAQELAGDRTVEVAAGDVGGQALAAGLVDEVAMDVAPVVFGSGKRYFGSVDAQHQLEDPDVVIQGNRVLHVRYRVRR